MKNGLDESKDKWIKTLYDTYKESAEKRNYGFDLTFSDFKNFWNRKCFYCGDEIKTINGYKKIGLDRVVNNDKKGYYISLV